MTIGKYKTAALAVSAGLALGACGGANQASKAPFDQIESSHSTGGVYYFETSGGQGGAQAGADIINHWFAQNAGRKLVALTVYNATDSGGKGFQVVSAKGNNPGQSCEGIEPDLRGDEDQVISGVIQGWMNHHADRALITVATLPDSERGIESLVICSAAASAK